MGFNLLQGVREPVPVTLSPIKQNISGKLLSIRIYFVDINLYEIYTETGRILYKYITKEKVSYSCLLYNYLKIIQEDRR